MSRALLGSWGAALPQEDLAQAVAAVGVLGPGGATRDDKMLQLAVLRARRVGGDIVPLQLSNLAQLVAEIPDRKTAVPDPAACLEAWARFRARWNEDRPPDARLLRLEIDPVVRDRFRRFAPDLLWLLRLLHGDHQAIADSVYVRVDEPDRPIAWEWPLRVGLLGDAHSRELADCLDSIPWPELVKLVRLDAVAEDCDLLLVPDNLRGAAARLLRRPGRLRADCVLCLGGAGVAQDRLQPLVATLRGDVLTGGVGVVRVDPECERRWITRLFKELSHDAPLDVALLRANRCGVEEEAERAEPPLLISSRRLVLNARITAFARRFGRQLRRMAGERAAPPPALEQVADELEARAEHGEWVRETADASAVPRMRGHVEADIGTSLPAERDGAPATGAAPADDRRVNFSVRDVTDRAEPTRTQDRLAADRAYEMTLFIGPPRRDVESASERFPSEKLPRSRDGHWLDVFFVPLVRASSGRFHTPQQGRLFLPPQGDSTSCVLSFRTHGVTDRYRARILITHENRVIQTLIFSSPLGVADRRFTLDVENVVAPSFAPAWQGKPFDAAIVVNHTDDGRAGFTTVVGKEVSFREPEGTDRLVREVKRLLSEEATIPNSRGKLDDPALLKLFDDLARYGRSILKPMPPELHGRVPEGARIQLVEARSGAWLPIEIFYGARVPKPDAKLCPNAHAALLRRDGIRHETCVNRDDPDHHCPLRFWGFNCVIERQPALTPPSGADYTISVPRPGADRLDAFRSALVGASKKVRAEDLTDPGGIVETVRRVALSAREVANWEQWESAVAADSPSLLMLLPHSQEDPEHPGISALEIGGVLLTYPELESNYVAGPAATAPVVLLLGCSTQLTEVPFLNFVEAFKREKAALVIGTLATIRGRRAVSFVSELLDGLKAAAGTQATFGDVFLETKRKLLAGGDGFVLSLTAYGDVGWRL